MKWQLRRGLLNPPDAPTRGSSWWRAMNERLLYDGCEAHALAFGNPGSPSSPSVAAWLQFIRRPTAASWYRAHNMSLVTAYLQHEHLASRGPRGTLLHQSRAGPCSLHPRAGCRAATGARLACPGWSVAPVTRGWVSPASSSRSRGCCPTAIPWVSRSQRSSRRNTVSGTWPLLPRLVTLRVSLLLMPAAIATRLKTFTMNHAGLR